MEIIIRTESIDEAMSAWLRLHPQFPDAQIILEQGEHTEYSNDDILGWLARQDIKPKAQQEATV
jgi:hypothetical protein